MAFGRLPDCNVGKIALFPRCADGVGRSRCQPRYNGGVSLRLRRTPFSLRRQVRYSASRPPKRTYPSAPSDQGPDASAMSLPPSPAPRVFSHTSAPRSQPPPHSAALPPLSPHHYSLRAPSPTSRRPSRRPSACSPHTPHPHASHKLGDHLSSLHQANA